ncbi:MAG: PrsW family glutamic-type intramembrane protease [Candidatus Altimarinota bacterium]
MNSLPTFYLVAGAMAFIPALIWLTFIFRKQKRKILQTFLFLTGIFSVLPIFLLQYFFSQFPQFNFIAVLDSQITNPHLHYLLILAWVSVTEELIKQWLIRYFDNKFLIIETINDSIQFSLISALGFSFAENIFYFYQIGTELGIQSLFVAYLFRSIFTTAAHLVFSGFFGYYYGIAKFSISIIEQSNWAGKKHFFSKLIGKILNISQIQAYRESTILKGLFLAIIMHTFFNYLLQLNYIIPATIFILTSYFLLRRLLKNRAGQLILVQDASLTRQSSMAQNDEQVVIELMGMWFNKKRFVDVIHICERLLKRDPDNKVVQLFKAKAIDQMELNNPYQKVLTKLFPTKSLSSNQKSIFENISQNDQSSIK